MSAASVIRMLLSQTEGTATCTGRRDYRVAAQHLAALVEKLEAAATAERHKKRRQRARKSGDLDAQAAGELGELGRVGQTDIETWLRTKRSVTLT